MATEVNPRPYSTTNRDRQAAETRRRIFDAARELFTRDGYVMTTIAAIAEHAGVAVQTVYASAKSKREILKGILDLAISDENEWVPVQASARWHQIEAESDPRVMLRALARLHREICVREAPVFAIMADAAGSDPEIRRLMHDLADQRYQDHRRLAKCLMNADHIRPDLTVRRAADVIGALANEHTYFALVRDRRWSPQDYEAWLADQLVAALLP